MLYLLYDMIRLAWSGCSHHFSIALRSRQSCLLQLRCLRWFSSFTRKIRLLCRPQ